MAPHILSPIFGEPRGYWNPTATIDWCESNYELSHYIAEFWNTLSNAAFIVPQLMQYISLAKHKNVEPAFRLAYLSLALVGLGSLCFHMTLNRLMQMFDETSMILVSLHGFYLIYIIRSPSVNKRLLMTLLFCYGLIFLSLYVFLVSYPIFHHTTFGLLVYASVAIGYKLKQQYGGLYKFWTVLGLQHTGFAFWLLDKNFCEALTHIRKYHIPSYLTPFFQFHAIWHLLMGLGTYIFLCGLIQLRASTKFKEEYVIKYDWLGLYIHLEKLQSTSPRETIDQMLSNDNHKLSNQIKNKPRLLPTDKLDFDINSNQVHYNYDIDSMKYTA